MKRLLSLIIILCTITACLTTPALSDNDDLFYMRRDWPVNQREEVPYIWWVIYPTPWELVDPLEYFDMDEDDQVSPGDVYDCGDQGVFTVTWVGHGLSLRESENHQNWIDVDGAGYPMPADPVGISYLTLLPDFGEVCIAEDYEPDSPWDPILLCGTWYDIMINAMAIRATWAPFPPSPVQGETWGDIKSLYRSSGIE